MSRSLHILFCTSLLYLLLFHIGSSADPGASVPRNFASASSDGVVKVWDARMLSSSGQAQELAALETHARITCMCVNDPTRKAAGGMETHEAEEQPRTVSHQQQGNHYMSLDLHSACLMQQKLLEVAPCTMGQRYGTVCRCQLKKENRIDRKYMPAFVSFMPLLKLLRWLQCSSCGLVEVEALRQSKGMLTEHERYFFCVYLLPCLLTATALPHPASPLLYLERTNAISVELIAFRIALLHCMNSILEPAGFGPCSNYCLMLWPSG